MALGKIIANLAVSLALETAAFEKGTTLAEKRFEKTRKSFEKTGKRMQSIGIKMSAAITAPLAGLGYALLRSSKQLVETSREMQIASQVAGESFEEFQRLAFGAKTVGIEADKLGDIFKDVQDKVGDFRATGGGAMADFFENIAPKVNLTAEAFKGLSGKDGLQLYYDSLVKAGVSSDEMRFYLEAIASDATMLIPLLEKGGAAFDEFGKSAAVISESDAGALEEYAVASQKMEASLQKLTVSIVGSGLLEAVTGIVTKVTGWVQSLSKLNPDIINWALGIGAVLAVLGPLITVVGTAITVGSGFLTFVTILTPAIGLLGKALLLLMANPVILAFAAVIAGIYLAWKNWDKIEPIIRKVYEAVKTWISDKLGPIWNFVKGAVLAYVDLWTSLPGKVIGFATRLYNGVKTWLQDKLGAVFDWVGKKIDTIKDAFFNLYDAVVGHSYIPDMVDGIAAEMARLDAVMVNPATKAAQKTADVMRDMAGEIHDLLDRLFPEIAKAQNYRADLELLGKSGLSDEQKKEARRRLASETIGGRDEGNVITNQGPLDESVRKNFEDFGKELEKWGVKSEVVTVRVAKSFKDVADETIASFKRMTDAFKGGGFLDILESVVGFGLQLGSIGAFGSKVQGSINSSVGGYATGTTSAARGLAWVGERGPELVNFRGGERVYNNADSRNMGGQKVEIIPSPYFDVVVDGRVMNAAPGIAQGGAALASQRSAFANSRRLA